MGIRSFWCICGELLLPQTVVIWYVVLFRQKTTDRPTASTPQLMGLPDTYTDLQREDRRIHNKRQDLQQDLIRRDAYAAQQRQDLIRRDNYRS